MRNIIKFLILVVLCITPNVVQGQIQTIQYWFDTNFAERKTESVTPNQTIRISNLDVNGLSAGIHHAHIRAKDNNSWSIVHSQMFYKLEASDSGVEMSSYEYWVDDDFSKKQTGSLSGQVANIGELNVKSYAEGIHMLNIRTKDKLGRYSTVHSQMFLKLPENSSTGMKSYEYWVDDDFSNKKSGTVSGQVAQINDLNVDSYAEGIHMLHIRAKDEIGRYSVLHSQMFLKLAGDATNNEISLVEYWFDNDFDNRKSTTVSGKSAIINDGLDTKSLAEGFHTMFVRAKDKQNRWSIVHTQAFFVNNVIAEGTNKIDAYRYWYDNDYIDHKLVEIKEPVNPYELKEKWVLPVEFKQDENHAFHIQFRDLLGRWSAITTDSFKIVPLFSETEFAALKKFYEATAGDQWTNTLANDSIWDLSSISGVNEWKGLVIKDGKVIAINLPENNLTQSLPSEFVVDLPSLKTIDVSGNKIESLNDPLPKTIALNIKSQFFDQGMIEITQGENMIIPILAISRYTHSTGSFETNNRFDLNINGAYKTRITSADGNLTISKSYLSSLKKGDVLTLVQYNGDAVGTTYQYTVDEPVVHVESVSLDGDKSVYDNETIQLIATITPSNATNQNLNWSSSDPDVAEVSSTGLVSAKKQGFATITVVSEDGGKLATSSITVLASSGISENHGISGNIYPNPVKDFLIITGFMGKSARIFSASGQKVWEKEELEKEEQIDAQYWASGFYIVHIIDEGGSVSKYKLVKE